MLRNSDSNDLQNLLSSVSQDRHRVVAGEVPHQLHEQLDVDHVVQQVLVLQLLRWEIADCLLEAASAVAVLRHDGVLDHLALLADKVLHLILDEAPVHEIYEAALDVVPVQRVPTVWVLAAPAASDLLGAVHVVREVPRVVALKARVAADVEVEAVAAAVTDDVGDDQDEAWLDPALSLA